MAAKDMAVDCWPATRKSAPLFLRDRRWPDAFKGHPSPISSNPPFPGNCASKTKGVGPSHEVNQAAQNRAKGKQGDCESNVDVGHRQKEGKAGIE